MKTTWVLPGLILSAGIALAGFFIADALKDVKSSQRFVTVKGLAEREIPANLGIWTISFSRTGNDLSQIQHTLDTDAVTISQFMAKYGFKKRDLTENLPKITDHYAYGVSAENAPRERYLVEQSLTLRTTNIAGLKQALQLTGQLVKEGITLTNQYGSGPEFLFTELNAVKPDMIAQATRNARKAAEQFAHDSGSRVGAIKSARQGLFSIDDRDRSSPDVKKIRVVNTLEFFLVD